MTLAYGPSKAALINLEKAAQEILTGIGKGGFEIHFPKRSIRWMKWLGQMREE